MIRDMDLTGFTPGTQQTYIGVVVKLQDHYNIRPDRLSEKQVQQYVLCVLSAGLKKNEFVSKFDGFWGE